MHELEDKEGDGRDGLYRSAPHLSSGGVDTTRHSDTVDRKSRSIDVVDQLGERTFDRTGKAGTEQRIHHHIAAGEEIGTELHAPLTPKPGHCRGIGRQAGRIAVEPESDLVAPFPEMARSNEAVAAVVPGAAQHHDGFCIWKAAGDLVGDCAACILHEDGTLDAVLNG